MRFTLEEATLLGDDSELSIHDAGLREVLHLARALELLPDEVILYGVQPATLGWQPNLSPAMQTAFPQIVQRVAGEVAISRETRGDSSAQAARLPNPATHTGHTKRQEEGQHVK